MPSSAPNVKRRSSERPATRERMRTADGGDVPVGQVPTELAIDVDMQRGPEAKNELCASARNAMGRSNTFACRSPWDTARRLESSLRCVAHYAESRLDHRDGRLRDRVAICGHRFQVFHQPPLTRLIDASLPIQQMREIRRPPCGVTRRMVIVMVSLPLPPPTGARVDDFAWGGFHQLAPGRVPLETNQGPELLGTTTPRK